MVYQFTGNVTSLNDFKVSEIQNPEGRFVNGKLEYGYTDHLGNLRLSYKDSLGVAFVTQSQHYDPWSNVNAGSEYQLAGIQGDRYLVSGKENDNITGNTLLDWRDYDSVTGRINSYDPEDQSVSLSGYAYCGNSPTSHIDPNGRFAFMPFLMATLFTGHISGMISQSNGGSYGKGFLTGAVTGALGGVAGAFAPVGLLPGMGYGAATGAGIGGIGSAMNGGNFWDGALSGGIIGGILGGIGGYFSAKRLGINRLTGTGVSVDEFSMPNSSGGDFFSSTDEMRNHYNSTIGLRDNMSLEQVESKINTTVELGSGRNLPKGYSVNENNGLFNNAKGGTSAGITLNYYKGGYLSSNHSSVLIAPSVKSYSIYHQNMVFKHEFMHAWHWNTHSDGLLQNRYSERATSSYSLAYEKVYKINYVIPTTREALKIAGGSYYPSSFSWRNFNKIIPTWLK